MGGKPSSRYASLRPAKPTQKPAYLLPQEAHRKPRMSQFELTYRTAQGVVVVQVEACDAEVAELQAPLEAHDVVVRALRRRGPSCRASVPAHWPERR
jgi:hypothetical protein